MKILDFAHYTTVSDPLKIQADAFIFKCGQGDKIDPTFIGNITWAEKTGKPFGGYWFLDPRMDPILQADLYCKTVLGTYQGPVLLAVDIEELPVGDAQDEWDLLTEDEKSAMIFKFLWRIQLYYHKNPFVYMSQEFYKKALKGVDLSAYPLWVPDYHSEPWEPRLPDCWKKWTIWQKTGTDKEAGLVGYADLDSFAGTLDDLMALCCVPV